MKENRKEVLSKLKDAKKSQWEMDALRRQVKALEKENRELRIALSYHLDKE